MGLANNSIQSEIAILHINPNPQIPFTNNYDFNFDIAIFQKVAVGDLLNKSGTISL